MQSILSTRQQRIVKLLTCLLILKVVVVVLLSYVDYIPPNFGSGFLRGRRSYFWGGYAWAFYVHIFSGPCSLVCGLVLVSDRFRMRFTGWHRRLGRIQVANVLLLVTPSGLWMAFYAEAGVVAGVSLGMLALATGLCVAIGWRSAVRRQFDQHRRWMLRCYVLLCSAVVLRLMGGLGTVAGIEAQWYNPFISWACWLLPLATLECVLAKRRTKLR